MACKYCKHYNKDKHACGLIGLNPKPYTYVVGGGCYPFSCAYADKYSKKFFGRCPLCNCDDPAYPHGKAKEGCPACTKVNEYGRITQGVFCESGIRVIKGIEYPSPFEYATKPKYCEMAECADGAWAEALTDIFPWHELIRLRKKLIPYLKDKYSFRKDGYISSNSGWVTLQDFMKAVIDAVAANESIGDLVRNNNSLLEDNFDIWFSEYNIFRRGDLWRTKKKEV